VAPDLQRAFLSIYPYAVTAAAVLKLLTKLILLHYYPINDRIRVSDLQKVTTIFCYHRAIDASP